MATLGVARVSTAVCSVLTTACWGSSYVLAMLTCSPWSCARAVASAAAASLYACCFGARSAAAAASAVSAACRAACWVACVCCSAVTCWVTAATCCWSCATRAVNNAIGGLLRAGRLGADRAGEDGQRGLGVLELGRQQREHGLRVVEARRSPAPPARAGVVSLRAAAS